MEYTVDLVLCSLLSSSNSISVQAVQVSTPITGQDLSSAFILLWNPIPLALRLSQRQMTFDILLAGDNLVNQKLAVRIFKKYHTIEIQREKREEENQNYCKDI